MNNIRRVDASTFKRLTVVRLYRDLGWGYSKISKTIHVSKGSIHRWLREDGIRLDEPTQRHRHAQAMKQRKLPKHQLKARKLLPKQRVAQNLRRRLRACIKSRAEKGKSRTLFGCSMKELMGHIEQQFRCGMNWDNYGTVWHVDHIKPLASFDLSCPEQRAKACHYTNLQPLDARENWRKGARMDWARASN